MGADSVGSKGLHQTWERIRQHIAVGIRTVSGAVPEARFYAHTGWKEHAGQFVYLHGGGAIGKDGPVTGTNVALGNGRLRDYTLPPSPTGPSLRQAVQTSLEILSVGPLLVTVPLLAATYRAPLGELVPIDFSVFLTGESGSQKTELTAISQAHFGSAFSAKNLPANWASTSNSLERLSFQAKDAVLVVDDFAPAGSAADVQRLHMAADRLLRAQGNRAGRGRMSADRRLLPAYFPRGLIISSGEDIPRGHSLRARIWIIEVTRGDVNLDRLTKLQAAASKGILAESMSAYVRWLAIHFASLSTLAVRHQELRDKVRSEMPVNHDRTPDVVASLALGLEIFLRFATDSGAITDAQRQDYWDQGWERL